MTMTGAPKGATLSEQVAEEIRAMMARRRITGAALARRLDVSPAWVSYRLTGVQPIDLNDLQAIAEVLDVDPRALFPAGAVTVQAPAILHPVTFPGDRLRVVGHRRATRLSMPVTCPPRAA